MCAAQASPVERAPAEAPFHLFSIDPDVFCSPIDFIAAEHDRQLGVCAVMDRLLHNPRHGAPHAEIEAVREYLVRDYSLHIADEEEDLFPILRRRCPARENIQDIFDLLHREHEADRRLKRDVSDDLEFLIAGRALSDPARFLMNLFAFSETQRRHLAWENAVVLPRAREHLIEADCVELGRRMAARRGMAYPG